MIPLFSYCLGKMFRRAASSPTIIQAASSPFDALPDDVVKKIFANLCTVDRVRMRLVCKLWREILMRDDIPLAPEAPWLILSNDPHSNPQCLTEICFESWSEQRIYRFKLPAAEFGGSGSSRWRCCGSSRGWLLIAGVSNLDMMEMFLWNPISGATRKLPALDRGIRAGLDSMSSFTGRVQVFSMGTVECVVAAIFEPHIRGYHQLALCTPQDESWSLFKGEDHVYSDISFHNGKLYASCRSINEQTISNDINETIIRESKYEVYLTGCDVEVDLFSLVYEDVAIFDNEQVVLPIGETTRERWHIVENLVESSTGTELFAVSAILDRCFRVELGDQRPIVTHNCSKTRAFEVRKLLPGDCLEKLIGIGEQSIFVGASGSVSVQASSAGAECIYFATDDAKSNGIARRPDGDEERGNEQVIDPNTLYPVREQGVFHVKKNRIENYCSTNLCRTGSITGWFTPKLFQR